MPLCLRKAQRSRCHSWLKRPLAVAGVLKAVVGSGEEPLAEGLAAERRAVMATFGSRDMAEGMAAFMEKRKPTFTGE